MDYEWPQAPKDDTVREQRTSKLVSLEISSPRIERSKIVVRNMSPHGLGIRADIDLLPCERVAIHLPGDKTISATVRWVRKNTFGLSLDERIEPDMLQPKANAAGGLGLTTKDSTQSFTPLKHYATASRTGFQRSHRDEVLKTSSWTRD